MAKFNIMNIMRQWVHAPWFRRLIYFLVFGNFFFNFFLGQKKNVTVG